MAKTKARPSGTGQATAVSANERARLKRNAYERARRKKIRAAKRQQLAARDAAIAEETARVFAEPRAERAAARARRAREAGQAPVEGRHYAKGAVFTIPEPLGVFAGEQARQDAAARRKAGLPEPTSDPAMPTSDPAMPTSDPAMLGQPLSNTDTSVDAYLPYPERMIGEGVDLLREELHLMEEGFGRERAKLRSDLNAVQAELTRVANIGLTGQHLLQLVEEVERAMTILRRCGFNIPTSGIGLAV